MSGSALRRGKHCGEVATISSDGVQVALVAPPAKAFAMIECGRAGEQDVDDPHEQFNLILQLRPGPDSLCGGTLAA